MGPGFRRDDEVWSDAKRAEADRHGRVSYGHGGAGKQWSCGGFVAEAPEQNAWKLVFRAPLWGTFLARQKGASAAGPRPGAASQESKII